VKKQAAIHLHGGYVLETTHGYYPLGTWGFAANLGTNRSEAESKLEWWLSKSPGEYRMYDNNSGEIVDAVERVVTHVQ
jgi:hypothetical protein